MTQKLTEYFWPVRHVDLIHQFAKREVLVRYQESVLGSIWAVVTPLLSLLVYTLVFRHVFKAQWGNAGESGLDFALNIYAGLSVFNFFSECLLRAPRLVAEQPNLVRKVVFPLEILPWVLAFSALFHLGIALVILIAVSGWMHHGWPVSLLCLPLVWLPLLPLVLGVGWLFSALGVFLKDINQLLGVVVSLLMFLSPVFYPLESLPALWRPWMHLNPLALVMEATRDVVLNGRWPDWSSLTLVMGESLAVALLGAMFFRAARHEFADVL
ncbi:MAG: ABC transporter permease [Candidatus Accumulibacter phosphatis]|jgi:lipopolysaccharide transport system permease protein